MRQLGKADSDASNNMFEEEVFEISEKSLNLAAVLEFFENVECRTSEFRLGRNC